MLIADRYGEKLSLSRVRYVILTNMKSKGFAYSGVAFIAADSYNYPWVLQTPAADSASNLATPETLTRTTKKFRNVEKSLENSENW